MSSQIKFYQSINRLIKIRQFQEKKINILEEKPLRLKIMKEWGILGKKEDKINSVSKRRETGRSLDRNRKGFGEVS